MSEGAVEGPVKSDFGFHVVRLDKILESGPLPLDQVRAELTAELQDQKAESLFLELERKLSDALFDAQDINSLAEAVGIEVKTAVGFTREGGEPLGENVSVADAIFDEAVLSGQQMSELIEIDANRTAVFAVTKHSPATRQALEDVRDEVTATLKAQQAEQLIAGRADEMLAALEAGADFAEAAAAVGACKAPTSSLAWLYSRLSSRPRTNRRSVARATTRVVTRYTASNPWSRGARRRFPWSSVIRASSS
jgi:peptidyl-prolyl cis-trans isomerase D